MEHKDLKRISKFLSLVLRHKPHVIGLQLDENGWASVEELLQKMATNGRGLSLETLQQMVADNDKKRFAFDESQQRIRASQGHSINIELGYKAVPPPELLYHGTGEGSVTSILVSGLEKRQRHHVHLSADLGTAKAVGQRHGKPRIFKVDTLAMQQAGHLFYRSENGVWLTEAVPVAFLELLPS